MGPTSACPPHSTEASRERTVLVHVSYSLNSLQVVVEDIIQGSIRGVIQGILQFRL